MAVRNLARQLLAHEADQSRDPGDIAGAEERACAKLRFHLVRLVGLEGFLALLSRAHVLASAEVSWLSGVKVESDGSPKGLREAASAQGSVGATEGYVVLLAHILSLLVLFIGETLTLRLVRDIWPETTSNGTTLASKEETER
jgi:hypothetical protein